MITQPTLRIMSFGQLTAKLIAKTAAELNLKVVNFCRVKSAQGESYCQFSLVSTNTEFSVLGAVLGTSLCAHGLQKFICRLNLMSPKRVYLIVNTTPQDVYHIVHNVAQIAADPNYGRKKNWLQHKLATTCQCAIHELTGFKFGSQGEVTHD